MATASSRMVIFTNRAPHTCYTRTVLETCARCGSAFFGHMDGHNSHFRLFCPLMACRGSRGPSEPRVGRNEDAVEKPTSIVHQSTQQWSKSQKRAMHRTTDTLRAVLPPPLPLPAYAGAENKVGGVLRCVGRMRGRRVTRTQCELQPRYGRIRRGSGSGWRIGVSGGIVRTLFDGRGIIARSVKIE